MKRNMKKTVLAVFAALLVSASMSSVAFAQTNSQTEASTKVLAANDQHGSIMLDTANYIMAPGNIYDIGVTIKDGNGNKLSGEQVKSLFSSGKIKVSDSRTGSIANLTQLPNGNFRVTGKNVGTCYIVYEGGGNHASVKIDVQRGAKQHGTAIRNTSYFTQNIGISKADSTTTPTTPTTPSTPSTPSQPSTPSSKTYTEGVYKVGTDLPAGEYIMYPKQGSSSAYYALYSDAEQKNIVRNDNTVGRIYLYAESGQYLKISRGILYPVNSAPKVDTSQNKLSDGMYKVGSDIPAGEYVVIPNEGKTAYFSIYTDSTANNIVRNNNSDGRMYIRVENGQYLGISRATLYWANSAPKVDTSKKELGDGMYKVGSDIPAGEYTIIPNEGKSAYYAIYTDITASQIVKNNNSSGTMYINVTNGQFIEISRGTLKL